MKGCNLQRCTYIVTISDDVTSMLHILPLFFFSTWHPCVPGEVLDEADRMFHMGFEYQAVAILVTLTGSIVLKPDSAMIDHRPPSVLTLLNLVSCVD